MCLSHLSSHQLCGYTHFNGINATNLLQIYIFLFYSFFLLFFFSFFLICALFSTQCIKKAYKNLTGTPFLKRLFSFAFFFLEKTNLNWSISLHCDNDCTPLSEKITFVGDESQWQWLRQHHRPMRKPETKSVKQKIHSSLKDTQAGVKSEKLSLNCVNSK